MRRTIESVAAQRLHGIGRDPTVVYGRSRSDDRLDGFGVSSAEEDDGSCGECSHRNSGDCIGYRNSGDLDDIDTKIGKVVTDY